ncbi:RNA ligase family protein [Paenibacillus sp. PAMC21692]|uniref:ATP-dependent DNA ligase n=1 Tax=Paenibacillus sp. PAMC21692 TaxID=2762320 RepID=UPI00164ECDF2|nr:RNA ligase family protein [Paenibacillus sp. PAMC21692]QNK54538.1 ATP-dependent DNA ligase [Paenibacillus sp. PAMC21692]
MFIEPMLLGKREEPFDDDRYVFQPKIDGHRLILSRAAGVTRLYTRHNNDVTRQYPELHNVPIAAGTDIVLDGEVARMDDTGWIDFEAVMERFRLTKQARIDTAAIATPVHYYVFDILRHNGIDVRSWPLSDRLALLAEVLTSNPYYSNVLTVKGGGAALFETIKAHRLEGIVAKRKDSVYVGRRSDNWLKIINYEYADVYIAGWRKGDFGWLAHMNGRPVGVIEFAVPATHKKAFRNVARSLITGEDRNFVYVEPRIKARVRFRNYYKSGMLRTPEFVDFVS